MKLRPAVLKNSTLFKNQKGFTLVEVLVAGAILITIALGTATYLNQMMEQLVYMQDKQSAMDLKNVITMDLTTPQGCYNSIGTKNILSSQNAYPLKNQSNAITYGVHGISPSPAITKYDRLTITSIKLLNDGVVIPHASPMGKMKIVVGISRKGGSTPLQSITIPVFVQADSVSNQITACAAGNSFEMLLTSGVLVCPKPSTPAGPPAYPVGDIVMTKTIMPIVGTVLQLKKCKSDGSWLATSSVIP